MYLRYLNEIQPLNATTAFLKMKFFMWSLH